jgi:hypothetical protein
MSANIRHGWEATESDKHASLLRSRINYARKIVVVYVHNRYKQETYEKDHKEKSVFAVSRTGERPNYYYCLFINLSGYKKLGRRHSCGLYLKRFMVVIYDRNLQL